MTRRRKTDGERIAAKWSRAGILKSRHLDGAAKEIDRIIRRRQKEAWIVGRSEGWSDGWDDGWATRKGMPARNYNQYAVPKIFSRFAESMLERRKK